MLEENSSAKKHIIMIGPVYPYKGGIAHYTALLCRALSVQHQVEMVSFKLLYPRLLYPGENQKDYANSFFEVKNVEYLINSINPLNWIKTGFLIKCKKPDIVIYQWWNPFFAPCYILINAILKHGHQFIAIALAHNVLPHEKFPFEKTLAKLFFKKIDHIFVQSKEDEVKLLKIKPDASFTRTVHPIYNGFTNEKLTKEEASNRIGVSSKKNTLLFFGFVRAYKGLNCLLEAMPEILQACPDTQLLIVGDFYDAKQQYVDKIDQLAIGDSVIIRDGYLPDHEVGIFFNAADLVVLPYISATQSGVVQIAYHYGVPVIVTNTGGLPEVVEDGKTGFVVNSHSAKDIAKAVIHFITTDNASYFKKNIENNKHYFSWERLVGLIERLGHK